ncbi:hypothetical protein B0H10DRAFT_1796031, partial [Mycena sp. CBHHK59/15]
KPSEIDYGVYEQHCDAFLQSPHGCVAKFVGGIISHLAQQVVNDDITCFGTTTDGFETAQWLNWDDALPAQEIDLICGHDTGMEDGMHKTNVSWWPKPVEWHVSGLDTGWWSPNCDLWFLKCLGLIRNKQAVLLTQMQWKHNIGFMEKSWTVGLANKRIAAEFLANY